MSKCPYAEILFKVNNITQGDTKNEKRFYLKSFHWVEKIVWSKGILSDTDMGDGKPSGR